jgi:hypothetical protein
MSALEDDSDPTYTHFAHHDEFFHLHGRLMGDQGSSTRSEKEEDGWVDSMGAIVRFVPLYGLIEKLDFYLPLPGLLDPYLEEIVAPLMCEIAGLRGDERRLYRLGRLVNWVVKVRGWKAVGKLG